MSCTCLADWSATAGKTRFNDFEVLHPQCTCEIASNSEAMGMDGSELIARLLTTPHTYSLDASEVIWNRLVRVYSDGLSFFRPGCTRAELAAAIGRLTAGGAEPQELVGASLTVADQVRACATDDERWFCAYATPAPEFSVHADVIARPITADSNTAKRKIQETRTRALRDRVGADVVFAKNLDDLVAGLADRGFAITE